MPKFVVISPEIAEESATYLAEHLGAEYINPYTKKEYHFPKKKYDFLFNYGVSYPTTGVKKINKASAVNIAQDKIKCIQLLQGKVPTVSLTLSRKEAETWLAKGYIVVARTIVKGDNGKGLVYCKTKKQLDKVVDVKFFTRYLEHTNEYRINVWKGKVLSVYDKKRKGLFFKFYLMKAQENHPQLAMFAEEAFKVTSLDWFGMDLLRTEDGLLHFLEVNSAPVLFPYTTIKLVENIKKEYT